MTKLPGGKKRLRIISWLMLASELLLLLFVAEWIRLQYREEERRLHQDMGHIFATTETHLSDSLLNHTVTTLFIAGGLNDSTSMEDSQRVKIEVRTNGNYPGKDTTEIRTGIRRKKWVYRDSVSFNDSMAFAGHFEDRKANRITLSHSSENLELIPPDVRNLMRVVLVTAAKDKKLQGITSPVDTALLAKEFNTALRSFHPGFHASWSEGNPDSTQFAYKPEMAANLLKIEGYRPYLLRQIMQQIAFSTILLLLTGLAFWLAYRNMRQQALFSLQKDNFISNMSHELKTPVATTKVVLEALNNYHALDDPARARKYLQVAGWEMDRLETMINKVMNAMQTESGALMLDKESLNLSDLLQEITGKLAPVLQEKGATLLWEETEPVLMVHADKTHITNTVYNLIDNALKYGGGKIRIGLTRNDRLAILKVADNGPGIPAEYRARIFDKFFRVPDGNKHNVKGYGLGLSYARYIVQAHGGDIKLSPDTGTCFIVSLPLMTTS